MCMVTLGMSRCHARSITSDTRVGNTSDARVCLYVFVYVYVCLEIVQKIFVLSRSYWQYIGDCQKNFPVSQYLYDQSSLHVHIFMIMASTGKQKQRMERLVIQFPPEMAEN